MLIAMLIVGSILFLAAGKTLSDTLRKRQGVPFLVVALLVCGSIGGFWQAAQPPVVNPHVVLEQSIVQLQLNIKKAECLVGYQPHKGTSNPLTSWYLNINYSGGIGWFGGDAAPTEIGDALQALASARSGLTSAAPAREIWADVHTGQKYLDLVQNTEPYQAALSEAGGSCATARSDM